MAYLAQTESDDWLSNIEDEDTRSRIRGGLTGKPPGNIAAPGDIRYPGAPIDGGAGAEPVPDTRAINADAWKSDPRGWFESLRGNAAPGSESLVGMKDKLAAAGWRLENPNAKGVTSKIIDPTGSIYRVGGWWDSDPSEGFDKTWEWVKQPGGGGGRAAAPAPALAQGPTINTSNYLSQLPTTPVAAPALPEMTKRDPAWDALYNQLLERSKQSLGVTGDEPVIKSQVDAMRSQANRDRTLQLKEAAERGGPYATGALANEARISGENVGIQAGSLKARLMGDELTARRQEIRDALSGAQGMMSAQEMARLREEDQQLARRGQEIGVGQSGFENEMNRFITARNAGQQDWENTFRDRGWFEDVSQQNWQNDYDQLFGF